MRIKNILSALGICASLILAAGCGCHRDMAGHKAQPVGAYTQYRSLEENERQLFTDVIGRERNLTPTAVSTQVVAGINYSFLCRDAEDKEYKVVVYQPLPGQGEPSVTSVEPVAKTGKK